MPGSEQAKLTTQYWRLVNTVNESSGPPDSRLSTLRAPPFCGSTALQTSLSLALRGVTGRGGHSWMAGPLGTGGSANLVPFTCPRFPTPCSGVDQTGPELPSKLK